MDYEQLKALIDQRGVHAVFGEQGEGWGIEQHPAELAEFLVAMQQLGVSSILEVGTGYRAGLARFLHDDMGWRVTSVDIQNYGHAYSGIQFLHPDDFTYDAAFGVPAEQFDLVLLDADHTYEGVKDQHEFYAPYATKVIAFHDIAGLRDCEGVKKYWLETSRFPALIPSGTIVKDNRELTLNPGYYEVIADGDQRGGIGYIVLAEVSATPEPEPEAPQAPVKPKPKTPRKPAAKKPAAKTTAKK